MKYREAKDLLQDSWAGLGYFNANMVSADK